MTGPSLLHAKRWRDRAQRWVAPGSLFDPRHYSVDVIRGDASPKSFTVQHHYSGTFPAARLSVGLFGPRAALVGVAVFSVPMSESVLTKWCGLGTSRACELGRFVCLPEVAYNGETWFLARALRLVLAEKGVESVLSFADPVERRNGSIVVKPAHWGTIYQASNALFAGRSKPHTEFVAPNGRVISPRALSKLRNVARGWRYAERQLEEVGTPTRRVGEHPRDWLVRIGAALGRARHAGNLAYVFPLTEHARGAARALHGTGQPFPKSQGVAA